MNFPEPAPPTGVPLEGSPAPASLGAAPAGAAPVGAAPVAPPAAPEVPDEGALSIAKIQKYVWFRYVKFEEAPFEVDEAEAMRLLEEHYKTHSLTTDSECFYYGILAYEQAFAQPDPTSYLRKALAAFLSYRGQTSSDFSFEAVDDRYEDALETLGLGGKSKPTEG